MSRRCVEAKHDVCIRHNKPSRFSEHAFAHKHGLRGVNNGPWKRHIRLYSYCDPKFQCCFSQVRPLHVALDNTGRDKLSLLVSEETWQQGTEHGKYTLIKSKSAPLPTQDKTSQGQFILKARMHQGGLSSIRFKLVSRFSVSPYAQNQFIPLNQVLKKQA